MPASRATTESSAIRRMLADPVAASVSARYWPSEDATTETPSVPLVLVEVGYVRWYRMAPVAVSTTQASLVSLTPSTFATTTRFEVALHASTVAPGTCTP